MLCLVQQPFDVGEELIIEEAPGWRYMGVIQVSREAPTWRPGGCLVSISSCLPSLAVARATGRWWGRVVGTRPVQGAC